MKLKDVAVELNRIHQIYINTPVKVTYDTREEMAVEAAARYRDINSTLGMAIDELAKKVECAAEIEAVTDRCKRAGCEVTSV